MKSEKVGVVILNYEDFESTISCVIEYTQQSIKPFIVVVDNNSKNNSYIVLKKEFELYENVIVIESGFNGGYAYGNNVGIRYLESNTDVETVIVSNNDISLPSNDLLKKWLELHLELDSVGITAPKMLINDKLHDYSAWKTPTFFDDVKSNSVFLQKLLGDKKHYPKSVFEGAPKEVDCLPGSLFMVNIATLKRVGYLDEGTFLYMEEVILSYKIRNFLNLKNYLIASLDYEHAHSKTISSCMSTHQMRLNLFRSNLYFASRYRGDSRLRLIILCLANVVGLRLSKLWNK